MFAQTFHEIRRAIRGLARTPTVAISATLCLALGIGATTAIASAVSRALFQRLPFRDPDALVAVHRITPQSGPKGTWPQSAPNYADLARESRTIDGLAALSFGTALVQLPDAAVQASQLFVTGNLFGTLGVTAQSGRLIGPDDDRLDQPAVAVVSDAFWRSRLGGDSAAVGHTLVINGAPTTIIGITPRDFRIPHGANVLSADIWSPIRFTPAQLAQRRSNYLLLLGRLARGATPASADAEMRVLFNGLVATYPLLNGENLRVAPLQAENLASVRTPLLLLFGAVVLVLLIAATNVAALLLARGVHRRRELAVRAALGASRWDSMRPVLAESAVITVAGAAGGILLAFAGVRTIGALAAARLRQLDGLHVDMRVIWFALALSALVALVCGAVPAWRGARVDPQDALGSGRGGGMGRSHHFALRSLVVLELSMSLVLLIGAGLVLKAFTGLVRNDPGFETAHVLTMNVTTSGARYANQTAITRFLDPALSAIRAVPGVREAAAITSMPYISWGNNGNTRYEGVPGNDPTRLPITEFRAVTPEFFAVTGQRLIAGRLLRQSDDGSPTSPPVVVVNQALVDRDFKGRDALGKRFHLSDTTFATIVGVVSNIRNAGPIAPPAPEMYWTYAQASSGSTGFPLMIRTSIADPAAVAAAVQRAIRGVDATAAIGAVRTMPDVIARSLGTPRFYLSMLGTFAAVAILLAVAGLYGVLSYAVAQRTREIGIRAALGCSRAALVRLISVEALQLVGAGLALGAAGGAAVTRLMTFMLYGTSPLDVSTWVLCSVLMVGAGMLAAVVPARRAARVDPLIAMQME